MAERSRSRSLSKFALLVTMVALVGLGACSSDDTDNTTSATDSSRPDSMEPTDPADLSEGGDTTAPADPTSGDGPQLTATLSDPITVASNLDAPWSIAFVGTTPLVSARDSGQILELDEDGVSRVVASLTGIRHGGEGGLLGIAVDDRDSESPYLFVYSTAGDGNRVQRFDLLGTPGSFSLGPPTTLIDGLPAAQIHNGGRLALGPDGMLYIALGDAAHPPSAQDLDVYAGKILRMTVDGEVPSDNPFADSYVYSYGHRNVQGLAWDDNGTLYASELGQNDWDELNIIIAGGNYGWPTVEGIGSPEDVDGGNESFINPMQQWPTSEASPSGLAYADGFLFMANLRGTVLRTIPTAATSTAEEWFRGEFGRIRDVVVHPKGDIWFLTNNTDGRGEPAEDDDMIRSVTFG